MSDGGYDVTNQKMQQYLLWLDKLYAYWGCLPKNPSTYTAFGAIAAECRINSPRIETEEAFNITYFLSREGMVILDESYMDNNVLFIRRGVKDVDFDDWLSTYGPDTLPTDMSGYNVPLEPVCPMADIA